MVRVGSFTVVTGHEDPSGPTAVDWSALARAGGTLVILMAAARAAAVADRLLREGMPAGTPVAIVELGTYPEQRARRTTLADLAEGALTVTAPATIVVGEVVSAATPWFAEGGPEGSMRDQDQ